MHTGAQALKGLMALAGAAVGSAPGAHLRLDEFLDDHQQIIRRQQ
jgi:hypothetical protein